MRAKGVNILEHLYTIHHEESFSKPDKEQEWGKLSAKKSAKEKYSKGKFFFEMRGMRKLFSVIPKTCSHMNNITNEIENPSALKFICKPIYKDKDLRIIQNLLSEMVQNVELNLKLEDCRIFFLKKKLVINPLNGIVNERNARFDHEKKYNVDVKQVGVIVSAFQPWLCASLDGIIFDKIQLRTFAQIYLVQNQHNFELANSMIVATKEEAKLSQDATAVNT
ncbi:hypothetical protein PV327_011049 [Microctonus hyperodae]|uniref:Uncharacterized protein n=1 Tax=Microctonus hyperodae TaxID=165561 RepID=A0AA39FRL7_MICHY|nr:hypothetical protein PV327_011049 [Microctonus hyperodae]